MKALSASLLALILFVACQNPWPPVITTTQVVDVAMKDWAQASVNHGTTPGLDVQVKAAYAKYQRAARIAHDSLLAYKNGEDQDGYINALKAVRGAVDTLVDLITPLISQSEAARLTVMKEKAICTMSEQTILALLQFATKFGIDAAIVFLTGINKAATIDDAIAALKAAAGKSADDYLAEARALLPQPASTNPEPPPPTDDMPIS